MPESQTTSPLSPLRAVLAFTVLAAAGFVWWMARPSERPTPPATSTTPAPPEEPKLGSTATLSAGVVQLMVAGNTSMARGTASDLGEARASFEKAIALDTRYAPAHAGLAQALVLLADTGAIRPSTVLPAAIEHGDQAVALDPAGALGWHALARAETLWARDWPRAEMHYRRALTLDPSAETAQHRLAELMAATGREAEARAQSRKALGANPRSPALLASAALVEYLLGDYPASERGFATAREAGAADVFVLPWRARAQAAAGSLDAAMATARQFDLATGGTSSWVTGYAQAMAGHRSEAEEVLASLGRQSAQAYVPALELAYLSLALGQREKALELVETAVGEHSRGTEYLAVDPILDPLRGEPRFAAALQAMRLTDSR